MQDPNAPTVTGTANSVSEFTFDQVLSILQEKAAAAGAVIPDFGTDEGDSVMLELFQSNVTGGKIRLIPGSFLRITAVDNE